MSEGTSFKIDVTGNAVQNLDKILEDVNKINNIKQPVITPTVEGGGAGNVAGNVKGGGDLTGKAESSMSSMKAMRKEFIQTRAQMILLAEAGNDDSAAFDELAQKAGKFKDAMGAVSDKIKTYSSGTKLEYSLQFAKEGFETVGNAARVAMGGLSLFGIAGDDVARNIEKMVAVEQMINGASALYNNLIKEGIVVTTLKTIGTKAAAVAETLFAMAVGTSTGALRAFRIAMISTGVGALVIGLGLAISKFIEWKEKSDDASESTKKFTEEQQKNAEKLKELKVANNQSLTEKQQAEIEFLRSQGKDKEALEAEKKALLHKAQTEGYSMESLTELRQKIDLEKERVDMLNKVASGKITGFYAQQVMQMYKNTPVAGNVDQLELEYKTTKNKYDAMNLQMSTLDANFKKQQDQKSKKDQSAKAAEVRMLNSAPKQFNITFNSPLLQVDEQNIISDDDVKVLEQKMVDILLNTLTSATINAQ